jgi:hypothetical protein
MAGLLPEIRRALAQGVEQIRDADVTDHGHVKLVARA